MPLKDKSFTFQKIQKFTFTSKIFREIKIQYDLGVKNWFHGIFLVSCSKMSVTVFSFVKSIVKSQRACPFVEIKSLKDGPKSSKSISRKICNSVVKKKCDKRTIISLKYFVKSLYVHLHLAVKIIKNLISRNFSE